MTDSLTGLYNRRAFVDECNKVSQRHGSGCLAIIDVDHFKKVNDTYGHDAGDQALIMIAGKIAKQNQAPGVVARLGGEEFALVVFGETKEEIHVQLEALRIAVEESTLTYESDTISLTVSIGAAFIEDTFGVDFSSLLSDADKSLYLAKDKGRNKVVWKS